MSLIFQTDPDSAYDVELAGVGRLGGNAKGGIPVERAAEVLHELQKDGEALAGKALEAAAREFADARGIVVKAVRNLDEEALRVEAGAFPAGKSIRQVSAENARQSGIEVPDDALPDEPSHETTDTVPPLVADQKPTPITEA